MRTLIACVLAGGIGALSAVAQQANGLVILCTDYGTDSIYVGSIKGAMYAKNPRARIDSLTNSVPAFDIRAGAYILAEGCQTYPPGTTFCVIVDPGVGTDRRCIVLDTEAGQRFVGPDNGILTLVADLFGVKSVWECTNQDLWRSPTISTTFHGRDIFGPVAAAIAGGLPLDRVGERLTDIKRLALPASRVEGAAVFGEVIRGDHYGNLVFNITGADLERIRVRMGDRLSVRIGEATFEAPWVATYGSVPEGERLIVLQSSAFVECAINMGSLADAIGEGAGAAVSLTKAE